MKVEKASIINTSISAYSSDIVNGIHRNSRSLRRKEDVITIGSCRRIALEELPDAGT